MKEIRKSFKVLWYPFSNSHKKNYRIDIFKKNGSFEKRYLNSKLFAKGTYKLYKLDKQHHYVIFIGKKLYKKKWTDYIGSFVVNYSTTFKKYIGISIPNTNMKEGMVKLLSNKEYKKYLKSSNQKSRRKSRSHTLRKSHRKIRKSRSRVRRKSSRRKL